MLNRRDMLNAVAGLPIVGLVQKAQTEVPSDELKAKAEMWDLFMEVVTKASSKVEKVGQQVPICNVSKRIGENRYYVYTDKEHFESTNLEEIYIRCLIARLKELS